MIEDAGRRGVQILCLQELFYGPYFCAEQDHALVQDDRARSRRADDQAHAGAGAQAPDGDGGAGLRRGEDRRLLQHRRGHRRRREIPRQVPQDPHPALPARLLGEVLLHAPATSAIPVFETRYAASASTSATTATSPRARARSGWPAPRSCSSPRRRSAGHSEYLWKIEQPAHAVANGYFVGDQQPRRQARRRGTSASSTASPTSAIRAATSSSQAGRDKDELVVADCDLDDDRGGAHAVAVLPRSPARAVRTARPRSEVTRAHNYRDATAQ